MLDDILELLSGIIWLIMGTVGFVGIVFHSAESVAWWAIVIGAFIMIGIFMNGINKLFRASFNLS